MIFINFYLYIPVIKQGFFFILTKMFIFIFISQPSKFLILLSYFNFILHNQDIYFSFIFLSLCSYLYLSYIYSYLLPDTADIYFYFSLYNNFMYFFPNWYHPDTPSELWFPYHTIPSTRGQGESKRCNKKKKRIKVMHISKCKPCRTCWQLHGTWAGDNSILSTTKSTLL